MNVCLMCRYGSTTPVLDLGMQPVSSHFMNSGTQASPLHPISLATCDACALVQLVTPVPSAALISPHEWIAYREPEAHLDDVVGKLLNLEGVNKSGLTVGVSFKDVTVLERFRKAGFEHVQSLNTLSDLGAEKEGAGVASIQSLLTPGKARSFVDRFGVANLVIARHILEHAERPARFVAALAEIMADEGYLVIEVPDCRANLYRRDYTMIWEEHSMYFSPRTLSQSLASMGLSIVSCEVYPFPFEDVIVVSARKVAGRPGIAPYGNLEDAELAKSYGQDFPRWSNRYHDLFSRLTSKGNRLAAYGAGHLTAAFLNFHDVSRYFACVVDDTPQKQGLFMPMSGLPIVAAERLAEGDIEHVLFGLAPDIEDKVIAKNAPFAALGGHFHSMFSDSPRSIRKLL